MTDRPTGTESLLLPRLLSQRGLAAGLAAVVALCSAGFALRVVGVSTSPLTFHSARQYLSLRVARADFLKGRDVPAWRLAVARAEARNAPKLEPRLLEAATVVGYRLIGGERMWVGGLISSVLWMLGGVCLFLIARRLASDLAAFVALTVHLFLPYSVVASRSFQPDPAMVTTMLAAVLAVLRYRDAPTTARLATAAGLAGMASLIKPTVLFVLVGAYLGVMVHGKGFRRLLSSASTWAYLSIAALPAAAFYAYGVATGGALRSSVGTSFLFRLWFEGSYWRGWASIVNVVVGGGFALFALAAVPSARRPEARRLMAGLFLGYAVFGLVFTYHIHTHDYYSLQLVPIVALGAGLSTDAAAAWFRQIRFGVVTRAAVVLAVLGLASSTAYAALRVAPPRPADSVRASFRQARVIGRLVSHSTRVITMAVAYGAPLEYHGGFAGPSWPNSGDLRLAALQGLERSTPRERLDALARSGNEWFVITDFGELSRQPLVEDLLDQRGRLAAEGEGYLVYDLRNYRWAEGLTG